MTEQNAAQQSESLRGRLIRAATGSFGLNVVSAGLLFVIGVVLARVLGAAGFGVYSYALSWVGLLAIPVVMGFDRLLVRETARCRATSSWGALRGLLVTSDAVVLVASGGIGLGFVAVTWFASSTRDPVVFYLAALLLPLQAIMRLRQSTLAGLERVVAGQVPEMVIRPVLFLASVLVLNFVLAESLDVRSILALNVAAMVVALGSSLFQRHRALPIAVRSARREFHVRAWAAAALPMLVIGGMQILYSQTDVIMLGLMSVSDEEIGIYSVVVRGTRLILLVMLAVNASIGPVVARMYAQNDWVRLQLLATRSARGMFAASLPLGLGLIAFGPWFLQIFGQPFVAGQEAMTILSVGKLMNALAGTGAIILMMTGREKDVAIWVALSALLNVAMNWVLIPLYGIEGAAIATAGCEILMSFAVAWALYRRLEIHATAFGPLPFRGERRGST